MLDRILQHATILLDRGQSYRLKDKRGASIMARPGAHTASKAKKDNEKV